MYSKEFLSTQKYGQLLKIGKTLGLKGGRQKAEKLIQSILDIQLQEGKDLTENTVNSDVLDVSGTLSLEKDEMIDDMTFPESSFSLDSSGDNNDTTCDLSTPLRRKVKALKKERKASLSFESTRRTRHNQLGVSSANLPINDCHSSIEEKSKMYSLCTSLPDEKKLLEKENNERKTLKRSGTFNLSEDDNDKRRSVKRSGTFNLSEEENSKRKSLKRSGTFNLSEEENNKRKSMKRSGTIDLNDDKASENKPVDLPGSTNIFSLSEKPTDAKSMKRSRSFIISEENECLKQFKNTKSEDPSCSLKLNDTANLSSETKINPENINIIGSLSSENEGNARKRRSSVVPSMGIPSPVIDLSCNEVQTAKDILYLEETGSLESPFKTVSVPRSRVRRSLRSHLLDSRLSVHQRISLITAATPQSASISNALLEEEENPKTKEEKKPAEIYENVCKTPIFTIGKDVEHCSKDKKQTSSIPRFVTYANKIKSKMPNFNKIHERAFNKMEALDDYVERKQTRTRTDSAGNAPSSTKKVVKETDVFRPTVTTIDELKIDFTGARSKSPVLFGMKTPVPDSKRTRQSVYQSPSSKSILGSSRKSLKASDGTALTTKSSSKPPFTSIPLVSKGNINTKRTLHAASNNNNNNNEAIQPVSKITLESPKRKATLLPIALPKLIKENLPPPAPSSPWNFAKMDPLTTPGSHLRRKSYKPMPIPEKEKPNIQFNSHAEKTVSRREIQKKMALKNPKVKTSTDIRKEQKVFIKGVRTNRRFELQMARRGINT